VRLLSLDNKNVSDEQLIKLMGEEWARADKTGIYEESIKNVLPA
jgi:hypothetical protein